MHCIDEVCPLDYADDLKYWMVDENFLEFCCQDKGGHKMNIETIKVKPACNQHNLAQSFVSTF